MKVKSKTSSKFSRTLSSTSLQSWKKLKSCLFLNAKIDLKDYGAIVKSGESFKLTNVRNSPNIVAEISYNRVADEKGWNKLSIKTYKENANSYQQAFLAGYLEGRISADDIYYFFHNIDSNRSFKDNSKFTEILNFFDEVAKNFKKEYENIIHIFDAMDDDEKRTYWSRIILSYAQIEGLMKGYNEQIKQKGQAPEREISFSEFFLFQADAEIDELMHIQYGEKILKTNPDLKIGDAAYFEKVFQIKTKNPVEFWKELMQSSRCSAFIKITKDENQNWKDLLGGHATFASWYELLRTYKQ